MKSITSRLCAGFLLVLTGCSAAEPAGPPGPRVVETFTVGERRGADSRVLTGTVRAIDRADLGFEIGGLITAVHVRLDAAFRAGDVLAELDTHTLQLAVQARESELRGATARLQEATANFERMAGLAETGAVSGSVLDTATAGLESARSQVGTLTAELARARANLRQASLRAPYDGRITQRNAEPGQVVQPGQAVFLVTRDAAGVEVVANVPGSLRAAFVPGHPIRVSAAGREALVSGEVTELGMSADRSGLYPAVIRLEAGADLNPGSTVRIELDLEASSGGLQIPMTALLAEPGNAAAVFRITDDDRVKRHSVEVARAESGWVLISQGLEAGDRIVARGAQLLRDGEEIIRADGDRLIFNP